MTVRASGFVRYAFEHKESCRNPPGSTDTPPYTVTPVRPRLAVS